jgi:hypothetical protein
MKNNILTGIGIGLILPVLAGIIFELFFTNVYMMGKRGIPYVVAILLNLLLVRYFAKKGSDRLMQGVMLGTFVFALLVFIFRFNK